MDAVLQKLCQALAEISAGQKKLKFQCQKAQAEVDKWQRRVELARQQGKESLAEEALIRQKHHQKLLNGIKAQLQQEPSSFLLSSQFLTLS